MLKLIIQTKSYQNRSNGLSRWSKSRFNYISKGRNPLLSIALFSLFLIAGCNGTDPDEDDKFVELPKVINTTNSGIPSNKVNAIYIDSTDQAWFGTDSGLARYDGSVWTVYSTQNNLKNNNVNDLAFEKTDSGNELWIATDNGVTVASYTADGITSATTYTNQSSELVGEKVISVVVDKNHNRWIGTDSAVNVFSGSTWKNQKKAPDSMGNNFDLSENKITDMADYEFGKKVFISTKGKGIVRLAYNLVDGFTGASTYASPWASLNSDEISSITVDGETQWYGTNIGAYLHPSIQTKSDWILYDTETNLVDNNILTIHLDKKSNIWIGTDKGISIITADGRKIKYTETEGLVNNSVNVITSDYKGNVWVGTSGGVEWFDKLPE